MNIKFNLEGIKVNVPGQEVDIEIGKLSYEVENLSMTESVGVLKEMPSIIRELRRAIEEPFDVEKEADAFSDAVQEWQERREAKSYIKTPAEAHEEARRNARKGLASGDDFYDGQGFPGEGTSKSYQAGASLARGGADVDGDKVTSIIGNNINPELRCEMEPSETEDAPSGR